VVVHQIRCRTRRLTNDLVTAQNTVRLSPDENSPPVNEVRLNSYGCASAACDQRVAAPARLGNTFRPLASSSFILFSSNARASPWLASWLCESIRWN
jgi:hypothetical protein